MQLDHIDLMLLHSPGDPRLRPETWRALEDLHEQVTTAGKAKIDNNGSSFKQSLFNCPCTCPAVLIGRQPHTAEVRL